jgi:hypothetical protein
LGHVSIGWVFTLVFPFLINIVFQILSLLLLYLEKLLCRSWNQPSASTL